MWTIRIRGALDPAWSAWLGGWDIGRETEETAVLTSRDADQSQLLGTLLQLSDLNVELLSVERGER